MLKSITFGLALLCAAFIGRSYISDSEASEDWRARHCRYAMADGIPGADYGDVRRMIVCAVDHWNVPGGVDGAICIAENESGLNPMASNPNSSAGGVYQWLDSSWRWAYDRIPTVTRFWELHDNRYNARASVVVSIRYAHDTWSWSPNWSVAPQCGLS